MRLDLSALRATAFALSAIALTTALVRADEVADFYKGKIFEFLIGGSSGGEDYTLFARFDRPATFNADTNFYALGRIEQLDEVNFFSRGLDLEAGIERRANEKRTFAFRHPRKAYFCLPTP